MCLVSKENTSDFSSKGVFIDQEIKNNEHVNFIFSLIWTECLVLRDVRANGIMNKKKQFEAAEQ